MYALSLVGARVYFIRLMPSAEITFIPLKIELWILCDPPLCQVTPTQPQDWQDEKKSSNEIKIFSSSASWLRSPFEVYACILISRLQFEIWRLQMSCSASVVMEVLFKHSKLGNFCVSMII